MYLSDEVSVAHEEAEEFVPIWRSLLLKRQWARAQRGLEFDVVRLQCASPGFIGAEDMGPIRKKQYHVVVVA